MKGLTLHTCLCVWFNIFVGAVKQFARFVPPPFNIILEPPLVYESVIKFSDSTAVYRLACVRVHETF